MGKPKSTGLIRGANAGFVVEKTLASPLAAAFSQHIPAWRPSATPHFLPKISDQGASAGLFAQQNGRWGFRISCELACEGI